MRSHASREGRWSRAIWRNAATPEAIAQVPERIIHRLSITGKFIYFTEDRILSFYEDFSVLEITHQRIRSLPARWNVNLPEHHQDTMQIYFICADTQDNLYHQLRHICEHLLRAAQEKDLP